MHPKLILGPFTQETRTIPEFDALELASCKKTHYIAINERHFCKVQRE